MNRLTEQEVQRGRVVYLNEEFLMFDPNGTRTLFNSNLQVNQFIGSPITLDTDGFLPQLPLSLLALPSRTDKKRAITPFDSELGYTITNEDLKMDSRIEKLRLMKHEYVDTNKAPLYLEVEDLSQGSLKLLGLTYQEGVMDKFYPEYLEKIKQLRLPLSKFLEPVRRRFGFLRRAQS